MDETDKMDLSDLSSIRDVDKTLLLCMIFWWIFYAVADKIKSIYKVVIA